MALRGESGLNTCLLAGKAVPLQKPGTHGTYVGVNPKGNDQPTKNTEGGKGGEYCILVGKAGHFSSIKYTKPIIISFTPS